MIHMIAYREFSEIIGSAPNCSRFELTFGNTDEKFIIVKYEEYISFSPFGTDAKEEYFSSLEELAEKKSFCGRRLEEVWPEVSDVVAVSTYSLSSESEKNRYFSFLSSNRSVSPDTDGDDFSGMSAGEKKNALYMKEKRKLDLFLEHGAVSREQYEAALKELSEK